MPRVGLGTHRLMGSDAHKAIKSALKLGYRLIDLATGMEAMTRVGISGFPRQDLFLTVKTTHGDRESAAAQALKARSALKVTYLDLLVLRSPAARGLRPNDPQHREMRLQAWKELEKLQRDGVALSLGVCDFSVAHLTDLLQNCQIPPCVAMSEITPLNTNAELIAFCKGQNVVAQAYSPLANGSSELLLNPKVQGIARELGKSPCQVVLKWTLQQGVCIIPRSSNAEHQRENGDLAFDLSADQMAELSSLDRGFRVGWVSKT